MGTCNCCLCWKLIKRYCAGGNFMTFEDLIKLKEAQEVIERLALSVGVKIEELNDEAYGDAHKSLGKVIDRWESKP